MRTRIYNVRIAPFADELPTLFDGELWVEDSRVAYVGPAIPSALPFDREIDAKRNLLLPGFKNAHTHSAMTFLRSFADDKPLQSWLTEDVFPMEKFLDPENVYWFNTLAIMEYLSSGITAAFDMYYHNEAVAQSVIDSGFRMVLCGAINDFGGTAQSEYDEYRRFNGLHPRMSKQLGFHAEYTSSRPLLESLTELSHALKAPVYAHSSETRAEVEGCIKRYGLTPTEFFDSIGMLDYGGGYFHCVHLSERDHALFCERGLYAVTNGGSNVKLASGIAPVARLHAEGVPVAIGTDGAASNNCLDFFREMFLVTGLQKLQQGADSTDAMQVLRSACCVGADAMGLTNCNSLTKGKQADLILLDLHQPNMQPENDLLKNVVYSGSKSNVALTMIAGQILYENGQFHIGMDPELVYQKANAHVRDIKNKVGR